MTVAGRGQEPDPAAMGRSMMATMDILRQVAAVAAGYRRQLTEAGVSGEVADQMALQLHDALMAQITISLQEPSGRRRM